MNREDFSRTIKSISTLLGSRLNHNDYLIAAQRLENLEQAFYEVQDE